MDNVSRVVRKLRGGETEKLTQKYWSVKSVAFSQKATDEEIFELRKEIKELSEDELVYLYWEIVYDRQARIVSQKALVKEYLLSEYVMRRREQ